MKNERKNELKKGTSKQRTTDTNKHDEIKKESRNDWDIVGDLSVLGYLRKNVVTVRGTFACAGINGTAYCRVNCVVNQG